MLLLGLHIVFVGLTLLRILSRSDLIPTTRLAWFLVIVVLPLLGVMLYFLFGEANLGSSANLKASKVYGLIQDHGGQSLGDVNNLDHIDPVYRPGFAYAASINGFGTTIGNEAELMPDAATARARLIEDIDNAKHSVNILYYIWLQDETGKNMADAVIRAAKRGVEVRVMADALGSRDLVKSKLWQEIKAAGVKTSIALPFNNIIKTILTSRFDLRNHRKITVIDGRITYCGSQNCADPEFRVKPKYAPWIDILVRFEGPVVAQNQLLFGGDWLIHEDDTLENFIVEPKRTKTGFPAQVWGDGPTVRAAATPQMFSTLMGTASKTLTISTPYFVPGDVVLDALCAAAYRGVDVNIIFPARNDSWIVGAVSRSHYREMLAAGVKIHEFEGGLLHSKILTIDGKVTLIGSSNMDLRSFDLNYENNILLQDEAVTSAVNGRLADYLASSNHITQSVVQDWGLFRRIWQNILATLGPVL